MKKKTTPKSRGKAAYKARQAKRHKLAEESIYTLNNELRKKWGTNKGVREYIIKYIIPLRHKALIDYRNNN